MNLAPRTRCHTIPLDVPSLLPRRRDRFGFRPHRPFPPGLFRLVADGLARLGEERETPCARAAVQGVLDGPYWGLRVLAIRVLADWGGRRNKVWLMERAARPIPLQLSRERGARWDVLETLTARAALATLLSPDDGAWLIDVWFAGGGRLFDGLRGRLGLMPDGPLRLRIEAEIAGGTENRLAVLHLAAYRATLPERVEILRLLSSDADPVVRSYATMLRPPTILADEPPAAPRPKSPRPPRTSHPPGRR